MDGTEYLALRLNGKVVYGLLDTGCDTSVVSRRVIPGLQLKQTTQKLYAANGTEIALLGEVEHTLSMSGAGSDRCRGCLRGGG